MMKCPRLSLFFTLLLYLSALLSPALHPLPPCLLSHYLLSAFLALLSPSPLPLSSRPPGSCGGGCSPRKMLGSDRGAVEEWLLEFKVKDPTLILL